MSTPVWIVRSVVPSPDYTLHLQFADGTRKVYDARPLLEKPIYASLKTCRCF